MKKSAPAEGYEMVKARLTFTATGNILTPADAAKKDAFPNVVPAAEPGWFWFRATPAAAASFREHGHRAVGSVFTTWIPPQTFEVKDVPSGNHRATHHPDGTTTIWTGTLQPLVS